MIDPFPQVTVRKEIPPKKCHEVRERPPQRGLELEVLDKQHRGQCCPNLNIERILSGPDKGCDL